MKKKVPHVLGPKIWNIVPNYFKDFNTENSFQKAIKNMITSHKKPMSWNKTSRKKSHDTN